MSRKDTKADSRFFSGNDKELQDIKTKERFQKLQKKKESRKRFSTAVRVALFIVLTAVFIIVCMSVFFRIDNIEIVGSSRYTESDILGVTDITLGESLFSVSDADLSSLPTELAYIKSATVTRKLPDTVIITVTEDEPRYFSDIYGQLFLLSDELRVLSKVDRRSQVKDMELVELVLPQVDRAIIGTALEFSDDVTDRYVSSYVDALASSPMIRRTTAFDLRQRFELALIADGLYLVDLGTGTELPTKLTVVAGMLENPVFSDGIPATIDAEDPEQCSVIKKADIKVAFKD